MAKIDYVEKAVKVTRREFLVLSGILGAVLWSGAYAVTDLIQDRNKYIKLRTAGLYKDDVSSKTRQSHHNKSMNEMYKTFAGHPLSEVSEQLFHTKYVDRTRLG